MKPYKINCYTQHKIKNGMKNISGVNIKKLRVDVGISQTELAKACADFNLKFSRDSIAKIELGNQYITDIELVAFSKIFGVKIEELLK